MSSSSANRTEDRKICASIYNLILKIYVGMSNNNNNNNQKLAKDPRGKIISPSIIRGGR